MFKKLLFKLFGIAFALLLLAGFLPPATATALSQPVVTFGDNWDHTISHEVDNMTITFDIVQQLGAGDTITIIFAPDYELGTPIVHGDCGPGWVNGLWDQDTTLAETTWTANNTSKTITGVLGTNDKAGETSQIRINITAGITNPWEISDYTLAVSTSQETTPVTSASYDIIPPHIPPLPGMVELYNAEGYFINHWTGHDAIQIAINAASVSSQILVGPGTYVYDNSIITKGGIAIQGNGNTVDDVIVEGTWTLDTSGDLQPTILDGMTLRPADPAEKVFDISGSSAHIAIANCVITKAAVDTGQVGSIPLIEVNETGLGPGILNILNCTFDSTDGDVADTIIAVTAGSLSLAGNTFILDENLIGIQDYAIRNIGGSQITIDQNTFVGTGGIGYSVANSLPGTVDIENNTFTGLQKAIENNNPESSSHLSVQRNLITQSSTPPFVTQATATAAIDIVGCGSVIISGNTISNNNGYALKIDALADVAAILMSGNSLISNTYGTINRNIVATLDASLNYWGDASGPAIATNPGGTGDPIIAADGLGYGLVQYMPWANTGFASVAAGLGVEAGGTIDLSMSVGIAYTSATAAVSNITLIRYIENPHATAPLPGTALTNGFYDVYSPYAWASTETTIMFFNDNVNFDTKVFFFNSLSQQWELCSDQAVAGNQEYAYITIRSTTSPTNSQLNGTVFCLSEVLPESQAPNLVYPENGATGIPTETVFSWLAVNGAYGYEIQVSEDPTFTFLSYRKKVGYPYFIANEFKGTELSPNTTYYWKVRAILDSQGTQFSDYSERTFDTGPAYPYDTSYIGPVNFHGIAVGSHLDLNTPLRNPTSEPLTVTSIDPVSIEHIFTCTGPALPFTIPAHGEQLITIRFAPTTEQIYQETFSINDGTAIFITGGYGVVSLVKGDVNGDGVLNVLDLTAIVRKILELD